MSDRTQKYGRILFKFQFCSKFTFRQPHQDHDGVDVNLVHFLDLALVGHVAHFNKLICKLQ